MTEKITLTCLNPQGVIEPREIFGLTNKRVIDLADKKIGLFWDGKQGGENFLAALEELLQEKYPLASTQRLVVGDIAAVEKAKKEVDTFVYGVGDAGLGGWLHTVETIKLEKLGKPGVFVVSDHAVHTAKMAADVEGMPTLRIVTVPAIDYFMNRISVKEIKPVVAACLDQIIDALTRPLTPDEINPDLRPKKETGETIEITGDSYNAALDELNQLYLENHMGDGLPLVPPTEEAVNWMLTGTTRSPDEVIGKVPLTYGIATIEKIAVNAVMAGARPEYLPVIIAAMEGLTDPNFSLHHVMTSEGSFTLMIMVSGPIAKKINMNAKVGLLGHGWRANNSIGRAVRLSLMNIGRLFPGVCDMALLGRPSSHTFYTFAENEAQSPWEPYRVTRGFKKEDSCVTVSTVGGHSPMGVRSYGGSVVEPWAIESILGNIIENISGDRRIFGLYKLGVANPMAHPLKHIYVIHPELAIALQRIGYTEKSLRDHLYDSTQVPYETLSEQEIEGIHARINTPPGGIFYKADAIPEDRMSMFKETLKPGGKVPVLMTPEDIHIIVAGSIPGESFGMSYLRVSHETKKIRGVATERVATAR